MKPEIMWMLTQWVRVESKAQHSLLRVERKFVESHGFATRQHILDPLNDQCVALRNLEWYIGKVYLPKLIKGQA